MRVGVMGSGWVANNRHIPVLRAHSGVDVVALFDRNLPRAVASAGRHGIAIATDQIDDFFSHRLDAVSICTSPWSHCELALAAFERGCHVLIEKPMAMNISEARRMAAAAGAADRILCVSHNFIFSNAVRRSDALLASGGPPRYVAGMQLSSDLRRLPSWYEELPAGLFFDEIPHLLYMMQHYLGGLTLDSVRVTARTDRGHPATTEVLVHGEYGPGQALIVSGAPLSEWHVSVVGQDCVVDLDLFRDIAVAVPSDGAHRARDILRTTSRAVAGHLWGFAKSGARLTTRRLFWGHDVLIGRFIAAANGADDSPVSVESALGIVALTDDILTSLKST